MRPGQSFAPISSTSLCCCQRSRETALAGEHGIELFPGVVYVEFLPRETAPSTAAENYRGRSGVNRLMKVAELRLGEATSL